MAHPCASRSQISLSVGGNCATQSRLVCPAIRCHHPASCKFKVGHINKGKGEGEDVDEDVDEDVARQ